MAYCAPEIVRRVLSTKAGFITLALEDMLHFLTPPATVHLALFPAVPVGRAIFFVGDAQHDIRPVAVVFLPVSVFNRRIQILGNFLPGISADDAADNGAGHRPERPGSRSAGRGGSRGSRR